MKRIYIIAGEPSGDFIGSYVMKSLKAIENDVEIVGVGGDLMKKEGLDSFFDIKNTSIGGVSEAAPRLFKIRQLIYDTVFDIIRKKPDVILTIDSPDFCFRVAGTLKGMLPNAKINHLVAPSVWAWRPWRARKVARIYDKLFTLFDFEPIYFTKYGLDAEFVGHPAVEQFEMADDNKEKEDILLIMPGSREQEIKKLLPIFAKASEMLNFSRVILPTLGNLMPLIKKLNIDKKIEIVTDENEKLELYKKAKLAIVAVGTATLQLSLSGCPMVVCHKVSNISYYIIKSMIRIKNLALVNIILDQKIVPELLQRDCTPLSISATAKSINSKNQIDNFKRLRERIMLNGNAPSKSIAEILLKLESVKLEPVKI